MALVCPRCGLKNPSTARRCDCGHRFLDDVAEPRSASPSPPRDARHCDNCGRTLGALERGLQRDGHVVCVECAPRLDAEHRSTRRTKPWPKLVAALAVAVIGAGAVLARHLAHNGGDDCQQAAHKIASRVSAEMGSSNEFDEAGYATKCRDRTNPRHLTAAHYRKQVDCVLKADSDDALIECMKRSEVSEASLILRSIGDAVTTIVRTSHSIPAGTATSTTSHDLCALMRREVRPDWSAEIWRAMRIGFMERPEQFENPQYAITYEGDANGFHVEAVGGTDCNGSAATWKLDGKLVNGEVETTGVDLLPAEARSVHQDRAAASTSTPGSTVAGSDGHAAVADGAPDADTTVDVFTNISENGMSLAFDHRTMAFRWQPNQGADRTLKNADTTPAVDACIRVLVTAVRRCQTCTIDSGRSKAAGSVDCWSTRAERCAYANGVPASAVDTCVQQVATAPCNVYEQPTWQLPTGCDGNGLADAAKWPGPIPPGRERQENDSRERPKANANIPIGCHEWFEMNASDQADMAAAVGKRVQTEYERDHSRRVVVAPGDYAALADAFTAGCKGGAKEDLYTVAKLTMEVAFANQ